MNENTFYQIGQRDMLANLFMEIRKKGVNETLKKWAEMIPENIYAKHYLERNNFNLDNMAQKNGFIGYLEDKE